MATSITIVGLGPGQWSDLTLQAYTVLARAAVDHKTVYFRTLIHPTLEPLEAGTQIVDATTLAALPTDEIAGKIIPTLPLLVAQVYNRRIASAVKLALNELYPDEWHVKLVTAALTSNGEIENQHETVI